jgi:nucleoid-associated protein YgaU
MPIYTIVSGDTLSQIAQRYGVDWHTLWELNKGTLQSGSPHLIYPSEQIYIPDATPAATAPAESISSVGSVGSDVSVAESGDIVWTAPTEGEAIGEEIGNQGVATVAEDGALGAGAVVAIAIVIIIAYIQWQKQVAQINEENQARSKQRDTDIKELQNRRKILGEQLLNKMGGALNKMPTLASLPNPFGNNPELSGIQQPNATKPSAIQGQNTYTVKPNDNLSTIAQKYGTDWQTLWQLNKGNLKSGNPNLIYPNEKIQVPNYIPKVLQNTSKVIGTNAINNTPQNPTAKQSKPTVPSYQWNPQPSNATVPKVTLVSPYKKAPQKSIEERCKNCPPNFNEDLIKYVVPDSILSQAKLRDKSVKLLTLNNAIGNKINLDYYSIEINKMPINKATGSTYTKEELLDYVRKNFDKFMNENTEFSSDNTNEMKLWKSTNPTSALMQFSVPLPYSPIAVKYLDADMTVITSNVSPQYWTFSTIHNSQDLDHPVSGNRMFGIQQGVHGDGSIFHEFYIRGADITSNLTSTVISNVFNDKVFSDADILWRDVINNINKFVNKNGGTSTISRTSHQLYPLNN